MKKIFFAVSVLFAMLFALPVFANNINVTIEGQPVIFADQQPANVDGRTLVPVRGVFETLGFVVDWEAETSTAVLTNADYVVRITIGSSTFTTNGASHVLDVPAQSIGGRTMLPLRAVLESVGYYVGWNGATSTVLISSAPIAEQPAAPQPPAPPVGSGSGTTVIVDGLVLDTSAVLIDENNVVQLPADILAAALGAYNDWNENRGRVELRRGTRRTNPFENDGLTEARFDMDNNSYSARTDGGDFQPRHMSTAPRLVGVTPYLPVIYAAEAFGATATTEHRGGELIITVTSRTANYQGYTIPQSHTDSVFTLANEEGHWTVRFLVSTSPNYIPRGSANFDARLTRTLNLLSQYLDESSIVRMQNFIDATEDFRARDVHDRLGEHFIDPRSNRHILMHRFPDGGVGFNIYEDGHAPLSEDLNRMHNINASYGFGS